METEIFKEKRKEQGIYCPSENMMNGDKILTLVQFARKAGKLVTGYDATIRALNRNQVFLVITAEDTAKRTQLSLERAIEPLSKKVPSFKYGKQAELGMALGLPETAVLGVLDKNFASKILEYWLADE